jgi:hypothetical protein
MQLLYLIPPAIPLAVLGDPGVLNRASAGAHQAAGQLGGSLAQLAVSEGRARSHPSAPITERRMISPGAVGAARDPAGLRAVLIAMAPRSLEVAGIVASASRSPPPPHQVWFRSQAKRHYFRRRQTSSRIATFAKRFPRRLGRQPRCGRGSWIAVPRDRAHGAGRRVIDPSDDARRAAYSPSEKDGGTHARRALIEASKPLVVQRGRPVPDGRHRRREGLRGLPAPIGMPGPAPTPMSRRRMYRAMGAGRGRGGRHGCRRSTG